MSKDTQAVTGGKKGRENYNFEKQKQRRQARAKAADERNGAYEALTVRERLALVHKRMGILGGNSKREIARLEALLAKEKAPAAKTPPMTETQKAVKAVKRAKDAAKA